MIDTIKAYHPIDQLNFGCPDRSSDEFEFMGMHFHKIVSDSGKVLGHHSRYNNLRFKITGNRITFTNSLSKFEIGNNVENMSYSSTINALETIRSQTQTELSDWIISRIDTGLVLTDWIAEDEYSKWIGINNNPSERMKLISSKKIYGRKIRTSQYDLKGYDKYIQATAEQQPVSIPTNSLRIEKSVHKMQCINTGANKVKIRRLSDLNSKDVFLHLGNDLVKTVGKIEKSPNIDWINSSINDLQVYAVMKDSETRKIASQGSISTYKKWRARYNRMVKNGNSELGQRMSEMVQDLSNR